MKMTRWYSTNATTVVVMVPIFLILSSSIYPAVIAASENRDMANIAMAFAQLDEKRGVNNVDTSGYHSSFLSPSNSPTPIALSPSVSPQMTENNPATQHSPASSSTTYGQSDTASMMSDSVGDTVHASAAGDLVPVVWADNTPGNFDIFYRRSLNGGSTFPNIINNLSNDMGFSQFPAMAVSGNVVHVVWQQDLPGNIEILYRRSLDGGATFGPTINLSNNAGISVDPSIAVSGSVVHVTWQENTPGNVDILYRRSTNGGAGFTEPIKNLSSNAGDSENPAVAVSGNNVHVVWTDNTPGNFDILYRRSLDGGSTFPNIIKNLSSNAGFSDSPAIVVFTNTVHVVWDDDTPGNADILYRRSLDGGSTFPNIIKNLSSNAGISLQPAIAVSGNNVHVVWSGVISASGNSDILYRRSLDGGTTFPNIIKNLSSNAGFSDSPAIVVFTNTVHVVWDDSTPGNFDIFYRRSLDGGSTFPNIIKNLSSNTGNSAAPAIGVS